MRCAGRSCHQDARCRSTGAGPEVAQVGAVRGSRSIASAGVVDPAYLEAMSDLPDAIEDDAVPLIAFGETPLAFEKRECAGRKRREDPDQNQPSDTRSH